MAQAQDGSFDKSCGIRSDDGIAKIMILDSLKTLSAVTRERVEAAHNDDGILHFPGLEITGLPQMITRILLTTDGWSTLDGVTVGMTRDDVLSIEELGEGPFLGGDGSLHYANGSLFDDPLRRCVMDVHLSYTSGIVASITIQRFPSPDN